MNAQLLINLIIWPPFIGFLINGIFGSKFSKSLANLIGCTGPVISFVATILAYMQYKDQQTVVNLYEWFSINNMAVNFSFMLDNLSFIMLFVVTGVGSLIHIYSGGYMHDDKGFWRFFSYLNLFLFSMLLLVLGQNMIVLFAGWEGVGLCSFLLIGFWFQNADYNAAARKAFVMNRIGDLGFLIAIFLIAKNYGTLNINEILEQLHTKELSTGLITLITLLLFVGVTGKSAQIPLFTWLPDAMAGPTPVSALIHAATMVTAGIYLVCRMYGLFELAPLTLQVITWTGILTALMAASIALKQNDIKKVLAYSTVSQLGYMVTALGVGAYSTAIFHVVTHAFFKALLFLCAGSVIHGLHGEQDISKMGGLKTKMKWTHLFFLIGTLAIVGCPPFAGFFSKDEILAAAYQKNIVYFIALAVASVCTAWYMFRIYFATFHGSFRGESKTWEHAHESPLNMTGPLFVLAILSFTGGFIGMPHVLSHHHYLNEFLSKVIHLEHEGSVSQFFEYCLWGITIIALAIIAYLTNKNYNSDSSQNFEIENNGISSVLSNKYYLDEIYDSLITKPLSFLALFFNRIFENKMIDGIVRFPGKILSGASVGLKPLQSGSIAWYLLSMVIGLLIFLFMFLKS